MDQLLTKQLAMKENMDPRGVKWGIGKVKGTSLYHVDILEGNKNTQKPISLDGRFTNPGLAQKAIEAFLAEMWVMSDEAEQKLARKRHADKVTEQE
jgi:hypothetical protein